MLTLLGSWLLDVAVYGLAKKYSYCVDWYVMHWKKFSTIFSISFFVKFFYGHELIILLGKSDHFSPGDDLLD